MFNINELVNNLQAARLPLGESAMLETKVYAHTGAVIEVCLTKFNTVCHVNGVKLPRSEVNAAVAQARSAASAEITAWLKS